MGEKGQKNETCMHKKQETRESLLLMIGTEVLLDYLSLCIVAVAVTYDDELAVLDAL